MCFKGSTRSKNVSLVTLGDNFNTSLSSTPFFVTDFFMEPKEMIEIRPKVVVLYSVKVSYFGVNSLNANKK